MTFYKGHKRERTSKLHQAYDEMTREAALEFATEELGYTKSGVSSSFADWSKQAPKVEAKKITPKKMAPAPRTKKTAPAKKKAPKKPAPKKIAA